MTLAMLALAAFLVVELAAIQRSLQNDEHAFLCLLAAIGLVVVMAFTAFPKLWPF